MSAARLLYDLQRAGFHLSADAGKLVIRGGGRRLTDQQQALIRLHKTALAKYCTPSPTAGISKVMAKLDLPMEDRLEFLFQFNERAAIREFDGGYPRREAERLASADILTDISRLHPQLSENRP